MYRILIIEDEFALADAIKRQIEGWGNEVCIVKNFQNVMQKFTEFDPHLVLLCSPFTMDIIGAQKSGRFPVCRSFLFLQLPII